MNKPFHWASPTWSDVMFTKETLLKNKDIQLIHSGDLAGLKLYYEKNGLPPSNSFKFYHFIDQHPVYCAAVTMQLNIVTYLLNLNHFTDKSIADIYNIIECVLMKQTPSENNTIILNLIKYYSTTKTKKAK